MSHRRTGTIAQLPRPLRDHVNRMLDDGCRVKSIIDWLAANGHPGVNKKQVSRWKQGGFQDWLEEQREKEREERTRELSFKIATENEESKAHEAALRIVINCLFRVFLKFDSDKLTKELDMKPAQITTVLNAFSRISRRSTELDMLKEYKRQQAEQRKATVDAQVVSALRPGLTDEGRAQIEERHNLM